MSAVRQYFRNIYDAVRTTAKGMRITLHYWVKEPAITVEYPDRLGEGMTVDDIVSERWRGYLGFSAPSCIGCGQCARICPIGCIRVVVERRDEGRYLTAFDVNQAKCMYCGLCVEECPTKALFFTRRFEGADFVIESLCVRHVGSPVPAAKAGPKKEGP